MQRSLRLFPFFIVVNAGGLRLELFSRAHLLFGLASVLVCNLEEHSGVLGLESPVGLFPPVHLDLNRVELLFSTVQPVLRRVTTLTPEQLLHLDCGALRAHGERV